MATRLQKKLAKAIVESAKQSKETVAKDLLVNVGYAKKTAEKHPGLTIGAKGVKNELNELGFSEEGAKKVVAKILYSDESKDHDKLDAADKVFKVHGSYAPDKHLNMTVEVEAVPLIKALTQELNALYRGTGVPGDGGKSGIVDDKAQVKE